MLILVDDFQNLFQHVWMCKSNCLWLNSCRLWLHVNDIVSLNIQHAAVSVHYTFNLLFLFRRCWCWCLCFCICILSMYG